MQTLNINDAGFSYIFKCLGYYGEGNVYLTFYLIALAFVCIKGDRRERGIFLPPSAMMLITVFNPVFPLVLNSFFDVNKEYYRFFWMLSLLTLISYASVKLILDFQKNAVRKLLTAAVILCIFISGGTFVYDGGYLKAENIYKMPGELPAITSMIHKDSKAKYPRAMFEYDYNMQVRQYDASILLPCDREAYLNAVSGGLDYTEISADENYYNRLLAVAALNMRLDREMFLEGMEQTGTEYFVLTNGSNMINYLLDMGLTVVGKTANHTVLHYELKERKDFELADYGEVWKLQGF